ncbi:hypothetical protein GCM10009551_090160 [Nocardiopsis tropica]
MLDPGVQRRLLASITAPGATPAARAEGGAPPIDLTPRETEVLRLIADGLANRDIATRLFVSESTVKTHINNLFAKAHLRDRAHAVRYAYETGIAASRQGD